MKNDGDEKGNEIASSGYGKSQSDKHRVENNTGFQNYDTEFLSSRRSSARSGRPVSAPRTARRSPSMGGGMI